MPPEMEFYPQIEIDDTTTPVAVIVRSHDWAMIYALSEAELELHRELHDRMGWAYTVYRREETTDHDD